MPNINRAQERHAAYYLGLFRQISGQWRIVEQEYVQIHQAIDYYLAQADVAPLLGFIEELSDYWVQHGPWVDFVGYATTLLQLDSFTSMEQKAELLGNLSFVKEAQGRLREAYRLYKEQYALSSQVLQENAKNESLRLKKLIELANKLGETEEVVVFIRRLLANAREQGNAQEEVHALLDLAIYHQGNRNLPKADELCSSALVVAGSIGYEVGKINALRCQAAIRAQQGDCRSAQRLYASALSSILEVGDRQKTKEIRQELDTLGVNMAKRVFISYNHNDRDFAERLARDLRAECLGVWWDDWDVKVGDSIVEKVSVGIKDSAYLAVILSPNSVQSNWVMRELSSSLMRQLSKERNIVILPLLITDCEIPLLLLDIKRADFRLDYARGFRQLLEALT